MIARIFSRVRSLPPSLVALLAGFGVLWLWAFWPTLAAMADKWQHDPQYSHGYLVPAFSIALLWLRRDPLQAVQRQCNWWGVGLLTMAGLLHFMGAYVYFDWLEAASLIVCLAGVCVLLGGWPALRWAWPALAFLMFMMPLPHRVETALGLPLRRLATVSSTYVLQTVGVPAISEGNTIWLEHGPIDIVEACSGLSMLLIFFALATAVAVVINRPLLDRLILVASAIPIALVANVVRISATGLCQEWVSPELAQHLFHDWAGWLMMPLALGLLLGELWLLSHLLVEPTTSRPIAIAPIMPPVVPTAKKKQKSRKQRGNARSATPHRR
jgi:exosortase